MTSPALLVALAAMTVVYFIVGLILYTTSIKRGYRGITAGGRTLAKTAALPAAAAAASILVPRLLPSSLGAQLRPAGLFVLALCLLAPPLLALLSEIRTRRRSTP